jgi:plastocyanin
MKSTYLIIPIAVALIHPAAHHLNEQSAARAEERAPSRASSRSGDIPADSEVTGRVIFAGQPPSKHVIDMAADPECAKARTGPALSEEVVIGPENALANVVVYLSDGLGNRSFDPPKEPAVIEQKGCQYYPHVVALEASQKIKVENDDATTHNIHPLPANNREWNQSQAQGVPPFEATFGREEVSIPVKCNIHPWMKGYIAVFKHPFFAVTGKDGKFFLKGLPAGEYTITAWQEKLGTLSQKVTVASSEVKNVEFIFKP